MKGLYELQVKLIQLKTQIVLREAHVLNILTFLISYLTFFKIINLPGMQTSTPPNSYLTTILTSLSGTTITFTIVFPSV